MKNKEKVIFTYNDEKGNTVQLNGTFDWYSCRNENLVSKIEQINTLLSEIEEIIGTEKNNTWIDAYIKALSQIDKSLSLEDCDEFAHELGDFRNFPFDNENSYNRGIYRYPLTIEEAVPQIRHILNKLKRLGNGERCEQFPW